MVLKAFPKEIPCFILPVGISYIYGTGFYKADDFADGGAAFCV